MVIQGIDLDATVDMIEAPDELRRQTALQMSSAPYLGLGFVKTRLDDELYDMLRAQFGQSAPSFSSESSVYEICNADPDTIPALYYEDKAFNRHVLEVLKPVHEAWSGQRLEPSACYGFRVYQRGTYLHNHVDRTQTHIVSSTICIDSRLDSPWPLYIENIDGEGFQVNMEPGEAVFYEGAKLIHGRPYPLNGDYYAGMFVHYRPLSSAPADR